MNNNNKYNILVTGCTTGLGVHLSKKFESEGHKVLRHAGRKHHDLSTYAGVLSLAAEAKEQQINCLINNAAIVCPNIHFTNYSPELIKDMINVNLAAPILLTYFLLTSLEKVVNINSMVGLEVKSPRTLYSSTKWGLRGFSNSLKKENNKLSILDVYPTNIKTTPNRKNAMDVDMVVDTIYDSFVLGEAELILDGRRQ